jgi:hypothetical protein
LKHFGEKLAGGLMDYEPGELGEGLDPEGEVEAFSYGERPGQYIEVEQLQRAMADEINWATLPEELVAKLEADRDRFLTSLSAEESRELVERLAAS